MFTLPFAPWRQGLKRMFSLSRRGRSRMACRSTFRPMLLQLEDRVVPSVTLGTQIPGLQFSNTAGYTPPDTIAAAGQTSVIETVNSNIALYGKNGGSPLFSEPLSTFFQSVRTGNELSDSVVAYDEQTQQFVVGVLDLNVSFFGTVNSDQFDYAVSKPGADPAASNFANDFTYYSVPLTNEDPAGSGSFFADYPRLGWNANAFVVSFNMFTTGFSESYDHPLVLNISTSNPATTQVVDVPGGISNSTVVPAVMHGATASDPMYLVEETLDSSGNPTGNSINVGTESNLFNSNGTFPIFSFTPVNVDPYTLPPAATQKGSSALIETNDSRILNAEWRDGTLVAAQTVGVSTDSQAHARWYQFSTTTTPTLVQDGTVGVGSGANSYFPSIAINADGNLGMTYIESSPNEYMSMYVTGRTSSDPAGQMQTPVLVQGGKAPYTSSFDSSPYRAGDFSGITVDPTDGSFWAANQYATLVSSAQSTNWGTAIAQFQVGQSVTGPPPTVTTSANAAPNPVTGTTTTLSVTATDSSGDNLVYQWSVLSVPSGATAPTFSGNNQTLSSGSPDSAIATFSQAGNYIFRVTIIDAVTGASTTSDVSVTVNQTLTSLSMSPVSIKVRDGHSQSFKATLLDQFGKALAVQPTTGFTWTLSGGGKLSVSTSNKDTYTAPSSGKGSATITASYSSNGVTYIGKAKVTYAR